MSQSISPYVEDVLTLPKSGKGIGFRRLQMLLRPIMDSRWGSEFTTIRITGSNGKGSVTALVHSILLSLGINCGRFTSPHLIRFNERIVIGDTEIADSELAEASEWIKQAMATLGASVCDDTFGSFELITALCIRSFFQAGISIGVMEAGIGGRYDPTRLLPGSLVALTSVDLEHVELLGNTKELIAYDKIDLCPDGGTIVSVRQDADLWERIRAYCRVRRLTLVDAAVMWEVESIAKTCDTSVREMFVRINRGNAHFVAKVPLVGTFQLENIAIACSVVELWARECRPDISQEMLIEAVVSGLKQVKWPGRFQQICDTPPVFIDVGHSPNACSRVAESVNRFLKNARILLVTGVSSNKSAVEILTSLVPVASCVICTRAHHLGERVDRIANIVRGLVPARDVLEAGTIEEATVLAKQVAESRQMTVLVAGGLFVAIEFWTAWEGRDPKQLHFY